MTKSLFSIAFYLLVTFLGASVSANPIDGAETGVEELIGTMEVIESETSVYQVSDFKRNAEDARLFCRTTKGHLVAIETEQENDFLKEELTEDFYWTSGTYDDYFDVRSWVWAPTGEAMEYRNWGPNQPITTDSEYGVAFYRSPLRSNWQVLPKINEYYFICEIEK